jgi:hypothetical protein
LIINEVFADPDAFWGDANGDGQADLNDDEFIELVNTTGKDLDLGGWSISDMAAERHIFPAGTILPNHCAMVVFAGGSPAGDFGGSQIQVASTGTLSLNDRGDGVIVRDDKGAVVVTITFGLEGDDNQSLTRDPDITGEEPLVKHTLATNSSGARYSPGRRVDGSVF